MIDDDSTVENDAVEEAAKAHQRRMQLLQGAPNTNARTPSFFKTLRKEFLARYDAAQAAGEPLDEFPVSEVVTRSLATLDADLRDGDIDAERHAKLVRRMLADAWVDHVRSQEPPSPGP